MIRSMLRSPMLTLALMTAVAAAACGTPATPAPTEAPSVAPTALSLPTALPPAAPSAAAPTTAASSSAGEVSGASLYQLSCAACHGTDGGGKTFDKEGNKIDTPSIRWSDLTTMYAADPSRGDAAQQAAIAITKGQDETGAPLNDMMPRWSNLSQAQVDSLVQYLQTIGTSSGPAPTLTPSGSGLVGEPLYVASCAACHGADGAGKSFDKDGQKIETPSIRWSDLTTLYAGNPSRGDAAQQAGLAITKGEDETGAQLNDMMPRWTMLTQAQVDSLVQYLESALK